MNSVDLLKWGGEVTYGYIQFVHWMFTWDCMRDMKIWFTKCLPLILKRLSDDLKIFSVKNVRWSDSGNEDWNVFYKVVLQDLVSFFTTIIADYLSVLW